jgi:predicted HicB family RNase H-like nuclease
MSQTLEYKGYNGSVLFSAEDKILHGSVLGIRDAVVYDGNDVRSLEKNFQNAVDEYLAFCAQERKTPDKPYKGSFNVRVGSELHKKAALYAVETHKKLHNIVEEALEKYLAHV